MPDMVLRSLTDPPLRRTGPLPATPDEPGLLRAPGESLGTSRSGDEGVQREDLLEDRGEEWGDKDEKTKAGARDL